VTGTSANNNKNNDSITDEKHLTLKSCALFTNLPEAVLQQCLVNTKFKHYEAGETIYDVGDVPDYVFVVKKGFVRLEIPLPDGEAFFVGPIPETALFGDHEALTNAQSIARTSAMEAVSVLLIPRPNFVHLFNTEIQFVQSLAKQLAMTSRFSCLAMAHLFKHPVENKLASLLLVLADKKGEQKGSQKRIQKGVQQENSTKPSVKLSINLSQDQLAEMLSTSRQTVNKYLGAWKTKSWICYQQGELEILDYDALKTLTSSEVMEEMDALKNLLRG